MDKEDLIIEAISEMKNDIRGVNKEIKEMSKVMASLASYHQRLNKVEEAISDLPKIRLITQVLSWIVGVGVGAFIVSVIRNLNIGG